MYVTSCTFFINIYTARKLKITHISKVLKWIVPPFFSYPVISLVVQCRHNVILIDILLIDTLTCILYIICSDVNILLKINFLYFICESLNVTGFSAKIITFTNVRDHLYISLTKHILVPNCRTYFDIKKMKD